MANKMFDIVCLMNITTGWIIMPSGLDEIYEILGYMTGENLGTVALPRAAKECQPFLYEQHPWLREVDCAHAEWLTKHDHEDMRVQSAQRVIFNNVMREKYGTEHKVYPMHPEDHEVVDQAEDARRLGFKGKVIEVPTGDEPSPYGNIDWKPGEN